LLCSAPLAVVLSSVQPWKPGLQGCAGVDECRRLRRRSGLWIFVPASEPRSIGRAPASMDRQGGLPFAQHSEICQQAMPRAQAVVLERREGPAGCCAHVPMTGSQRNPCDPLCP
jgi:hypothetical protein